MKLDRNVNPDGRGKYALINLRKNTVEWGSDEDQFFVIKYKDRFAAMALFAYADAVQKQVAAWMDAGKVPDTCRELSEYATEIYREAERAKALGEQWNKIPD